MKIKQFCIRLAALCCCGALAFLSGCSEKSKDNALKYDFSPKNELTDGILAENSRFSLVWETENYCVSLQDKETGAKWGTIPSKYVGGDELQGRADIMIKSPIYIEYITSQLAHLTTAFAYNSVRNGDVSAEKIENGVRVTYAFSDIFISVPVDYVLTDYGISVSVNPALVAEGENKLFSISLNPFMCSAANSAENYLFVPSGSGALMYTDNRAEGERTFDGMIYGSDIVTEKTSEITNIADIRLPVFGAKDGNNAILAIVESGDEFADISAVAGNQDYGFSAVYPTFYFRGYDKVEKNTARNRIKKLIQTSDYIRNEEFTVGYRPLSSEKSDYSGMAECYRNYLNLKEKSNDIPLNINIIGGIQGKKNFIGIPYKNTEVLTDYNAALEMIKDLSQNATKSMSVTLTGFGKYGISVGKLMKGLEDGSAFGKAKEQKSLIEYMKSIDASLSFAYNTMNVGKGEIGISASSDTAKTTTGLRSLQYKILSNIGSIDNDASVTFLLIRSKFFKVTDKINKLTLDKKLNSVDLLTLGNYAYSDYASREYSARSNIKSDFENIVTDFNKSGISVSVHDANAYAAALADCVLDTPLYSARYDAFDCDIPFYPMVFKGHTALSSVAINQSSNPQETLLRSLESGCGLSFVLIDKYKDLLSQDFTYDFYSAVFSDNRDTIISMIDGAEEFLLSVTGVEIKTHEILADGIRKTTFENGNYIVVNYTDKDVSSFYGNIKAMSYITGKEN